MSSNNNITDNRVTLNGVKVYPFRSFDELLAFAEKHKGILVSINAEKILHATDETRGIINRNIGFCDGAGAVYALRQKGHPEACKLPGCELWLKTIAACHRDKTFYLVGGRQEVIDETVAKLRREYPGIRIVAYRNGYLKTPEERAALIDDVAARRRGGETTGLRVRGHGLAQTGTAHGGNDAPPSGHLPRPRRLVRCLHRTRQAGTALVGRPQP